jgi:hypothetical protein
MTETLIICSNHIFPPDYDGISEYPNTVLSMAKSEGWHTTTDKLFSMDGKATWICSQCCRWLFFKRRDELLADIEAKHERRKSDIWGAYRQADEDEGVRHFREVCRVIDDLRREIFGADD